MSQASRIAGIILETLAETGNRPVPEGQVYAAFMGHMDLSTFQSIIGAMVDGGLAERRAGPCIVATADGLDIGQRLLAARAASKAVAS